MTFVPVDDDTRIVCDTVAEHYKMAWDAYAQRDWQTVSNCMVVIRALTHETMEAIESDIRRVVKASAIEPRLLFGEDISE